MSTDQNQVFDVKKGDWFGEGDDAGDVGLHGKGLLLDAGHRAGDDAIREGIGGELV